VYHSVELLGGRGEQRNNYNGHTANLGYNFTSGLLLICFLWRKMENVMVEFDLCLL